jgi:hypothetical protein
MEHSKSADSTSYRRLQGFPPKCSNSVPHLARISEVLWKSYASTTTPYDIPGSVVGKGDPRAVVFRSLPRKVWSPSSRSFLRSLSNEKKAPLYSKLLVRSVPYPTTGYWKSRGGWRASSTLPRGSLSFEVTSIIYRSNSLFFFQEKRASLIQQCDA